MTEAGNKYLLIAMDYFSKWAELFPLPILEAARLSNQQFMNLPVIAQQA